MVQEKFRIPLGFNMSGGKLSNKVEVCPGTIYWILIKMEKFSGEILVTYIRERAFTHPPKGSAIWSFE